MKESAEFYKTDTLIETGTFLGDMIFAMKDHFKDIYSIELSPDFHSQAVRSFSKYPQIHLVQGDSGCMMAPLLRNINSRCLFWLDGHYSGGITATIDNSWSPINVELDAIIRHPIKNHVILIDDANAFDGTKGYPKISDLYKLVLERMPQHELTVYNNIIKITPVAA